MTTRYYQIGGYGRHSNGWFKWDDKALAKALFTALAIKIQNEDCVELVLGVRANGCSYIHITESQLRQLRSHHSEINANNPYFAPRFASLSPTVFHSPEEILVKLKDYESKKKDNYDTSKANKPFALNRAPSSRPFFEQQRILYRVLYDTLDLPKFSLDDVSWRDSVIIRSFVANVWALSSKAVETPRVMDMGWADVLGPPSDKPIGMGKSTHIRVKESQLLNMKDRKPAECKFGTTQLLDRDSISRCLEDFFSRRPDGKQLLLLVCGEDETLKILRSFGVDCSTWESGILSLLGSGQQHPDSQRDRKSSGYSSRDRYCNHKREESPPLRYGGESSSSSSYARRRSGPPVILIDVNKMHEVLRTTVTGDRKSSLSRISADLGVPHDAESWCAGNECQDLFKSWERMASGAAIDEQRRERWGSNGPVDELKDEEGVKGGSNETHEMEEDSEEDTNYIPTMPQAAASVMAGEFDDYDGEDDSEDE